MSFKRLQTMQKKLRGNSTRDLRKVGLDSNPLAATPVTVAFLFAPPVMHVSGHP
jgi:hypothetical protein